jgi:hypothetical protein
MKHVMRPGRVSLKNLLPVLVTTSLTSCATSQNTSHSGAIAAANGVATSESFASVFTPNAQVCVRFDAQGHVVAAAVGGRPSNRANLRMLALLRSRRWDPPPPAVAGRWIALAVAPDGSPVPEVLPDCRRLPR